MRKILLVWVMFVAVLQAGGATVRGQLYRQDQRGNRYAAVGIPVRLNSERYGPSSTSGTDMSGMYYLYGVPPGDFILEVILAPNNIWRFPVHVNQPSAQQPTTDVPPIKVP